MALEANRVVLDARIEERQALRYTPAGIPVSELLLTHASEQEEDGSKVKVELGVAAVAIGTMATTIEKLPIGQELRIKGFLARKSVRNLQAILHIQDIRIITS